MTLDTDTNRQIYPKCQTTNYMLHGKALNDYNIIEYFVNTYKDDVDCQDHNQEDEENIDLMFDEHCWPGRPQKECIHYLSNHPKYNKKLSIKQHVDITSFQTL